MDAKTERQCNDYANRLIKKYKHLKKWAKRSSVTCYRLYDADIPEVPVVVDLYEAFQKTGDSAQKPQIFLHIALYERPYQKDEKEEELWFSAIKETSAVALQIPLSHIFTKVRKKQRGESQYEKNETKNTENFTNRFNSNQKNGLFTVQECGAEFLVNLSDYIDTGLFFDHRPLRSIIKSECEGKHVLNLFCYTGSFSVYAALGGAASVDSVDLSKTYLEWAERNIKINITDAENQINQKKLRFIHQDVLAFVSGAKTAHNAFRNRWDIIILDPPTFSNSKRAAQNLDINKDWILLVNTCISLLNKNGILYFSTNSKKLRFDQAQITMPVRIQDITEPTIPEDFKGSKPHKCWKISLI